MSTVVVILNKYSGTTWQIPSDCYGSVTVECIGPGGDNSGRTDRGGGGGAYTKNTFTLSSANVGKVAYVYWYGNTWLNWNSYAAPTSTTEGVLAAGGVVGTSSASPGLGGQASACIPITGAVSGGNGSNNSNASGGGAGPSGVGLAGSGNNGGAGNGGTVAGGTMVYGSGTSASVGLIYTDFFGNRAGPGGGSSSGESIGYGKSSSYTWPANAVGQGSGGPGATGNGVIVITYTSQPTPQGRYVVPIDRTGTSQWRVPDGVTAVKVEALGAGAKAYNYGNNGSGTSYYTSGIVAIAGCAGGGGAYASNTIKVSQNNILYTNIPAVSAYTDSKTWLNTTNAVPTSLSTGVIAAGASTTYYSNLVFASNYQYASGYPQQLFLVYSKGGQASDCLGQLAYSGGDGATTYTSSNTTNSGIPTGYWSVRYYVSNTKQGNAGGGGAAGPNGPGGNGGQGYFDPSSTGLGQSTGASGGAGGGGGANGGSVGSTATSTTGANGGTSLTGTAGGIGTTAYTTTAPTAGASGSGGGGGSYYRLSSALSTYIAGGINGNATIYANAVSYTKGGDGSTQVIASWNPPGVTTYGPGSGGGGAARFWWDSVNSNYGSVENNSDGMGGSGGKYGGGQGMGNSAFSGSATTTSAGQGLVVIQYTVTTSKAATFLSLFM
jgi:hypothetical protein